MFWSLLPSRQCYLKRFQLFWSNFENMTFVSTHCCLFLTDVRLLLSSFSFLPLWHVSKLRKEIMSAVRPASPVTSQAQGLVTNKVQGLKTLERNIPMYTDYLAVTTEFSLLCYHSEPRNFHSQQRQICDSKRENFY